MSIYLRKEGISNVPMLVGFNDILSFSLHLGLFCCEEHWWISTRNV
jgi:hypothetical protein